LLELADGARVETVRMPYPDRVTLCISSQVGCRFACGFCQTGVMGLQRSLTAGEIVGQVLRIRAGHDELDRPVNVVFMGQGEPLDNVDNVITAVGALQDPRGPALGWRKITVSTVGVVSALPKLAAMGDARPRLAVSLNATTNHVRSELMPINRRWPIEELLAGLRQIRWRKREHVTFEYVMLADVNDDLEDARRLGELLSGLPAKVNLIPWNSLPTLPYRRPGPTHIERFRKAARATGLDVLVRYSRGADIAAACGQLHSVDAAAVGAPS
jgi:23S rRNA (adenine2503-C2)-methyltransferase